MYYSQIPSIEGLPAKPDSSLSEKNRVCPVTHSSVRCWQASGPDPLQYIFHEGRMTNNESSESQIV